MMARRFRVIRRLQAERDLVDPYLLIAEEQPQAADRFAAKVEDVILSLRQDPKAGSIFPTQNPPLDGLRRRKVPGFPVLVFYLLREEYVLILRILHGARDLDALFDDEA